VLGYLFLLLMFFGPDLCLIDIFYGTDLSWKSQTLYSRRSRWMQRQRKQNSQNKGECTVVFFICKLAGNMQITSTFLLQIDCIDKLSNDNWWKSVNPLKVISYWRFNTQFDDSWLTIRQMMMQLNDDAGHCPFAPHSWDGITSNSELSNYRT
jgi:hypothetical protein